MSHQQPNRHHIELGLLQTDPTGYTRESLIAQFLRGAHSQGIPTMLFAVSSTPAQCGRHEVWATPIHNVTNESVIEGTRAVYGHILNDYPINSQFVFKTEDSDHFKNEEFKALCRELEVVCRQEISLPVLESL